MKKPTLPTIREEPENKKLDLPPQLAKRTQELRWARTLKNSVCSFWFFVAETISVSSPGVCWTSKSIEENEYDMYKLGEREYAIHLALLL